MRYSVVLTINMVADLIPAITFGLLMKFLCKQTEYKNLKIATTLYFTAYSLGALDYAFALVVFLFATINNANVMIYDVLFWAIYILIETAHWYFAHMYYIRVNEVKYLYLFGYEHAQKRRTRYSIIFWVILAIQIFLNLALLGCYIFTGNFKFLVYNSIWFAISFGFDLLVLLVSVIQMNIILRKKLP